MQYIIFDLEATCWERSNTLNLSHEIIEIGAVKLDQHLNEISLFQCFVKPTINPILSDFCTELTSIQQSDVDQAPTFEDAIDQFVRWIDDHEPVVLSWGYYDKSQLIKECEEKKVKSEIIQLLNNHHSLKHEFAEITKRKPCGMQKALNILNIELIGTHHRGIDDAQNIAKIFKNIFPQWLKHTT